MINTEINTPIIKTQTDDQNRITKFTEVIKDPHGKFLSKRVDEYSYYPTGEVDVITLNVYSPKKLPSTKLLKPFTYILLKVYTPKKLTSTKLLKHFIDNKQPQITIKPEKEI